MKKKAVERISEDRQRRIELLEGLLGKRKEQLRQLQSENEGLKQTVQLLTGIVLEGIERKERVEIPRERLKNGIKCGYILSETEDAFVLEKQNEG